MALARIIVLIIIVICTWLLQLQFFITLSFNGKKIIFLHPEHFHGITETKHCVMLSTLFLR